MPEPTIIKCRVCGEDKHWPDEIQHVEYHPKLERPDFVCTGCMVQVIISDD